MIKKSELKLHPKTLEIHGGGSLADVELRLGVDRVVAYALGSFDRGQRLFSGEEDGFIYSRMNNRTVDRLQKRLAALEGAESCLAVASGMAAITLISIYLAHGHHIVSSNRIYGGVYQLFRDILPKLGIDITFVENPSNLAEWESAINFKTAFLHLETPSNPLIEVFDIKKIAKLAHSQNINLVVDSTLASPALLQPLKQGADVVIHSLSKYVGNGEAIGGAILGKKELIRNLELSFFRPTGFCMSADSAAIFLSNVESLFGRMAEHCKNTEAIAKVLSRHPKVNKVFYPSVGSGSKENKKLMPKGFGGLMAFEVAGGRRAAKVVLESLKLFWHAPNIGESPSLVICPAATTHGKMTPEERSKAGISEGILRLSIGREDKRDLINDLDQALAKV